MSDQSVMFWAQTHPGTVRSHNEDALLVLPERGLWAVADGAGGHESGEVASAAIVDALAVLPGNLSPLETLAELRQSIADVHLALRLEAAGRGAGVLIMSTLVLLLIREGHYVCLWAGDSRAYLLRDGAMEQITRDHSLVQGLVDAGVVAPEAAEDHPHANIITRAVGGDEDELLLDKVSGPLSPGDRFLLCSDGLFKAVPPPRIAEILSGPSADPARLLLEEALADGAKDNVSAIVVDVERDAPH